jgi:hypothetical protein
VLTAFVPPLVFVPFIGGLNVFYATRREADARSGRAHDEIERMAAIAERERIARDLHDLLGHTLSVIVLKSELASKLAASQPERAAEEIRDVERISRRALTEVREAVVRYRRRGLPAEVDEARDALRRRRARRARSTSPTACRRRASRGARAGAARGAHQRRPARSRQRLPRAPRRGRRAVGARGRDDGDGASSTRGTASEASASASRRSAAASTHHGGAASDDSSPASRPGRRMIRVVIAEDQAMVRGALAALLALEGRPRRGRRGRRRRRGRGAGARAPCPTCS